jgi:NADH-quinone oxidoreductase subunit J
MVSQYVFYFLALLSVITAILVVASRSPVHSVLYLIITFFCIAGQYLLLNAQFLFVVQLIVYSGAIMVLLLFVVMLLNLNRDTEPEKSNVFKIVAAITGGSLMLCLLSALRGAESIQLSQQATPEIGLVKSLGKVLFTDYVVPFELSSILFLSAMVGAVMLGKRDGTTEVKL